MTGARKIKVLPQALLYSALGLVVGAVFLAIPSCADPQAEYDDFVKRTDGIRGVLPDAAAGTDAGGSQCVTTPPADPPDLSAGLPNLSGTYFGTCLANFAACDTHKALRFRVTVSETSGGAYSFTYQPLHVDTLNLNDAEGPPFSLESSSVAPDGTFSSQVQGKTIAGEANPFSGNLLLLKDAIFHGQVTSGTSFCAELDGVVEVFDAEIPLEGAGDICLFYRAEPGGTIAPPKLNDYHCP
jgi:hypothetical protein